MVNPFDSLESYEDRMKELDSKFIARINKGGYWFFQSTDGVYLLGKKIPDIDQIASAETIDNITVLTGNNGISVGFKNDTVNKDQLTDPKIDFIQGFAFSTRIPVTKIGDVEVPEGDSIFIDGKRNLLWNGNVITGFDINQAKPLERLGLATSDKSNYFTDGKTIIFGGEKVPLEMNNSQRSLDKNTLITDTQVIVQGKVLDGVSPQGIKALQNGHYINDNGIMFYSGIEGGEGGVVPGVYSEESLSFGEINVGGEIYNGFILIGMGNPEDPNFDALLGGGKMVYKGKLVDGPWNWISSGTENGYPVYTTERYGVQDGGRMIDGYNKIVNPKKERLSTHGWEGIHLDKEPQIKIGNKHFGSYYADSDNSIYSGPDKVIDFHKLAKLQHTDTGLFQDIITSLSNDEELSEFIKGKLRFYNIGHDIGKRFASVMR